MSNKLNVPELEYKPGEPMWVHWDDRYIGITGVIGKCPHENLITTLGYLVSMDDRAIVLSRSIRITSNEEIGQDLIQIPMSLVASYGSLG